MEHQEIMEKLTAFRDPEMPESEKREITAHLEICAECRNLFSRWERLSAGLRRTALPEASDFFVSRVMKRLDALEEPEPERVSGWRLPRWLVMSIGYAFGISLMFLAIANRQTPVNAAVVLLSDVPQSEQWTFVSETPDSGQVLGVLKEDV